MANSEMKTKAEQEQAISASRQWKVMRKTVKGRKVSKDKTAEGWFRTIFATLSDDIMEKLDTIRAKWDGASPKDRASLCRELQLVIFEVRPDDSITKQRSAIFDLGKDTTHSSITSFLQIIKIMKDKMNSEEKGGYTQEDHESWKLTIDSVCTLIKLGLPVGMGLYADKTAKLGKAPRNSNSKIASYMQHLKVKQNELWMTYTDKIKSAVADKKKGTDMGKTSILDEYVTGLEFDQAKVVESGEEESTSGLFTGMANVDWLLLAAYHLKSAKYNCETSVKLLRGVAAFSLLSPLTKTRAQSLRNEWPIFIEISDRFEKGKELYMCPLALTQSRLVNSAATIFEAASDICILRSRWTMLEIVGYVAEQLDAQGGIQSLNTQPGTTSSVEWMVHRLLLTGADFSPSKFVKNPLRDEVIVRSEEE